MVAVIERSRQIIRECDVEGDFSEDVYLVEYADIRNRIDSAIVGFVGTSDPSCHCKEVAPMFSSACFDVTQTPNPPVPAPDFD